MADAVTLAPDVDSTPVPVEDDIKLDDEDLLFTQAIQSLDVDVGDLDLDESEQLGSADEADIYISLGNYDTAEEILTKALERNSDDVAAHLKLLTIYGEKKDESAFDEQVSKLEAFADSEIMGEALRTREGYFGAADVARSETDYIELPDDDDFSFDLEEEASDSSGEETETDLELPELELPDFEDRTFEDPVSEGPVSEETDSEDLASESLESLDLDTLDFESSDLESSDFEAQELDVSESDASVSEDVAESTPAAESDEGDGLDFDLDLDLDLDFDLDSAVDEASSGELADSPVVESPAADSSVTDDLDLDLDLGEGLDMLDGNDEMGTQLELAQAYVDMGDSEGAREILEHVAMSGSADQQTTANNLLSKLG